MNTSLLTFKSHVSGKNADVSIFPDRVEWSQKRSVSWKLAMCTLGFSLLTLLMPRRQAASEMIPVSRISSVITRRKSVLWTTVSIVTVGNTIDFNVSHDMAAEVTRTLNSLILASA